ncbi:uncharacterized protein LY89DRAFT_763083 [Mollisia scopiformis]|uniref:BTB domain-containing protein n=1 Tax=Mollisia scopiformis TaxID=149040 RepID=A0A194XQT0_MOLSC|nr:uncharacterized protein LY89DRAFT_763083 [Mollisia scopiformis]KUJ22635.1 hypothetical protein LY89DRAFT_763083 [Mollisia scopiformis]
MSEQTTIQAFVRQDQAGDPTITDMLGSEMVVVAVGKVQEKITIHKGLLDNYAPAMSKAAVLLSTQAPIFELDLPNVDVAVFKLFAQVMYSGGQVPSITATMLPLTQIVLIRSLAQLYTFFERYHIKFELCNKIMDRIQDGYVVMKTFPSSDFASSIYKNTSPVSKLRLFATSCLAYQLRMEVDAGQLDHFKDFLMAHPEMLKDFLATMKGYVPETDPRNRQCNGEPGCTECGSNKERMAGMTGYWPCYFHIHYGYLHNGILKIVRPAYATEEEVEMYTDPGCYLWNIDGHGAY